MTRPSRSAICAVALATVAFLGATAHAQDAKFACRETINKEYAKYVKTVSSAFQKCNDAVVAAGHAENASGGGDMFGFGCPEIGSKIAAASGKMDAKIHGKCSAVTPAEIGWSTCPNFEGGNYCVLPTVTSFGDVSVCLDVCNGRPAVRQAMDLYYLDLANPGGNADLIKCQRAIGKATTQFLTSKQKILGKCRATVDKGKGALPCPGSKEQVAIAKAEAKKVGAICKACGTASTDGVTCTGPGFTPAQIGFASGCPAVTVPAGGRACGGPVAGLNDLIACVDCVTEFKVDCLDALSRPDQGGGYPPECLVPVPTPTPTSTPTATITATFTPGGTQPTPTETSTPPPGAVCCALTNNTCSYGGTSGDCTTGGGTPGMDGTVSTPRADTAICHRRRLGTAASPWLGGVSRDRE